MKMNFQKIIQNQIEIQLILFNKPVHAPGKYILMSKN